MADLPILFSGPMVRALLAGTKTQTRRTIQPYAPLLLGGVPKRGKAGLKTTIFVGTEGPLFAPRYAVGDRLYVRERVERANGEAVGYPADGSWLPNTPWVWERATLPSIHMPRHLSRLTLTVTDVRVERLQDITEADALAEGMTQATADAIMGPEELAVYASTLILCPDARGRILYETIWDQLNGDGAWDSNPWVVAYSFSVHLGNIDGVR